MFDIGFGEMILLAAIALIAIGPKQLPEVARTVGRMLNEFKRATGDLTKTFVDARDSTNQALMDTQRSVAQAMQPPPPAPQPEPQHANFAEPVAASQEQHASEGDSHNQMSFDLAAAPEPTPERKDV